MTEWLVRQAGSEPIGPVSTELVIRGLQAGRVSPTAEVCRVGERRWAPISTVSEFVADWNDSDETNVTDNPWFLTQAIPARQSPPARISGIGLPPPAPRAPLASRPGPPPVSASGPQSSTLVAGQRPNAARPPPSSLASPQSSTLVAGQRGYGDVDDDAATRLAGSPLEDDAQTRVATSPIAGETPRAAGSDAYDVDDETMTRVARPGIAAPPAEPARKGNVLPTMPMSVVSERPLASPRPAAGEPPRPAREPDPGPPPTQPLSGYTGDVQTPQGSFPSPQPLLMPAAPPPPLQGSVPPGYYPTPPAAGGEYHYPAPQPPPRSDATPPDQGLKALVAIIVFLAVALAIVLILLVIRK